ncbi:MAG: rhomboid family intramembrane serine protease [Pirellulaceae bacterium]|nr:rhomboid family intramembrane serine protease [Pirellulaceae bacterium]
MGLHDRDYGREYGEETPWERHQRSQNQKPKSAAIILLVITGAVFLIDMLFLKRVMVMTEMGEQAVTVSRLAEWFATRRDTLIQPWTWFQFLTYGFVHDHRGINHLLFNMIGLFFFGRAVEQRLGFNEFLRFYLVSTVVGGIVGSATFWVTGSVQGSVIGASGAVIATTVLFACYYPTSEILLMFVLPVKAWVVAVFFVVSDLAGALGIFGGVSGGNTAFTVHLSGAFFALLYYFRHWNLRWLDFRKLSSAKESFQQRSRRMKLKIHDPDQKIENEAAEADRILAKIHQQGEESLTSSERKTLERYSRRQREKRTQ